jgi:hypothetical protein
MANFINSLYQTIRYFFLIMKEFGSDKVIIGTYARTVWSDQDEPMISYISFSPAPNIYSDNDYEMDDYGVLDDDVFYYATRMEFAKRLWTEHPVDNWRITGFWLNTTELVEQ